MTALVGAERHERSDDRTAYRNGTGGRRWDTRVGTIALAIPKVRAAIRLVGAILSEQDDEWAVAERHYFGAESMQRLLTPLTVSTDQELLMAIA